MNTFSSLRIEVPSIMSKATEDVPITLQMQLHKVCVLIVQQWISGDAHEIASFRFKKVSGGITNSLFRVEKDGLVVLVRIFGFGTERMIDRKRERKVAAALLERNYGVRVLGEFQNGRVEVWMSGRSLNPFEMQAANTFPLIAHRLGEIHALSLSIEGLDSTKSAMKEALDIIVSQALKIKSEDHSKAIVISNRELLQMRDELSLLRQVLRLHFPSRIVLAHNDLLSGNVMFQESAGALSVRFIDFEYSSFNFRGFDIANHFCECCGFDCNWNKYPTKKFQLEWLRHYIAGVDNVDAECVEIHTIESLYDEVQPWKLMSHIFWGFWAVMQAAHSSIDFDFLGYARKRFEGYHQHKAEMRFVSDALTSLESESVKLDDN